MARKPHCDAEPPTMALICSLDPGHPGEWHWDEIDDITWREGQHTAEVPGE